MAVAALWWEAALSAVPDGGTAVTQLGGSQVFRHVSGAGGGGGGFLRDALICEKVDVVRFLKQDQGGSGLASLLSGGHSQ